MKPIARVGDTHVCGNPSHPPNVITSGGQGIVDGQPVARIGDSCACGAVITSGSSQFSDNGQAIAYLGSTIQVRTQALKRRKAPFRRREPFPCDLPRIIPGEVRIRIWRSG